MEYPNRRPRRKILIINERSTARDALRLKLEFEGFEVCTEESAPAALVSLSQRPHSAPDLVICGLLMPGLSGFELIWRLRALGIQTPVLMLSRSPHGEDADAKQNPAGLEHRWRALLQ